MPSRNLDEEFLNDLETDEWFPIEDIEYRGNRSVYLDDLQDAWMEDKFNSGEIDRPKQQYAGDEPYKPRRPKKLKRSSGYSRRERRKMNRMAKKRYKRDKERYKAWKRRAHPRLLVRVLRFFFGVENPYYN